jgi:GT2 family glycosyltransferase
MGWKAVYVPAAVAYHARRALPSNRRMLPGEINMHSVKNRFLMRIKNLTWGVGWRTFPFFTLRDLLIIGYIALLEPSSWKAFSLFFRSFPRALEKRKQIMKKKAVGARYMAKWFAWNPRSESLSKEAAE